MNAEDKRFRELLAKMTNEEKRAYKRATFLTAIPIAVGIALIAISVLSAFKMKKSLEGEIRDLELKKISSQESLARTDQARADAELKLREAKEGLSKIEEGVSNPKAVAKETLAKVTKPNAATSSGVVADPKAELTDPEPTITDSTPTTGAPKPGFVSDYRYRGFDGTTINVQIVPDSADLPMLAMALDGAPQIATPKDLSFTFKLDKKRRNPSRLLLFLDFVDRENGACMIKISASDGSTRQIGVRATGNLTTIRGFTFEIF